MFKTTQSITLVLVLLVVAGLFFFTNEEREHPPYKSSKATERYTFTPDEANWNVKEETDNLYVLLDGNRPVKFSTRDCTPDSVTVKVIYINSHAAVEATGYSQGRVCTLGTKHW